MQAADPPVGKSSSRHVHKGFIVNLGDPLVTATTAVIVSINEMVSKRKSDNFVVPMKRVMTVEGRGLQERKEVGDEKGSARRGGNSAHT